MMCQYSGSTVICDRAEDAHTTGFYLKMHLSHQVVHKYPRKLRFQCSDSTPLNTLITPSQQANLLSEHLHFYLFKTS